jgi:mono/diheme cytochrome c family protein
MHNLTEPGRKSLVAYALAFGIAACGGERSAADDGAAADTTPPGQPSAPVVPNEPTPAMIARGDSIFHGQAAFGTCFSCHGDKGSGGTQGPNLTDAEWLHTDGTMQGIANTISTGISMPKQFPAQMPPMGGADLAPDDLLAVTGYVYSLSH